MTPHEKLGLAVLGVILALLVLGAVTHYCYLARWWWPVVGSAWRAERHRVRLAQRAWDDVWQEETQDFPGPDSTTALRAGDASWDDLDPDSQADQLIAEWHDEPNERLHDDWPTSDRLPAVLGLGYQGDGSPLTFRRWEVLRWDAMTKFRAEVADLDRQLAAA